MVKKWECLGSATGEASAFIGFRRDKLAVAVRKSHFPDFSNWPPPAAFARAFARLEKVCARAFDEASARQKRWRATALQDAGASMGIGGWRETYWTAPALWRFVIVLPLNLAFANQSAFLMPT